MFRYSSTNRPLQMIISRTENATTPLILRPTGTSGEQRRGEVDWLEAGTQAQVVVVKLGNFTRSFAGSVAQ